MIRQFETKIQELVQTQVDVINVAMGAKFSPGLVSIVFNSLQNGFPALLSADLGFPPKDLSPTGQCHILFLWIVHH